MVPSVMPRSRVPVTVKAVSGSNAVDALRLGRQASFVPGAKSTVIKAAAVRSPATKAEAAPAKAAKPAEPKVAANEEAIATEVGGQ